MIYIEKQIWKYLQRNIEYLFRQESYFNWCFGVLEPGCYGALDVDTGNSYLFFPRHPPEYAVWLGPLTPLSTFKVKYDVTEVFYVDELDETLRRINRACLLTLRGLNTDSGLMAAETKFEGIDNYVVDNKILFPVIAALRVYKTQYEIDVMKFVIEFSSEAHLHVMRMVKAGMYEYECESEFKNYCYRYGGCRHVSYTCICKSGPSAAVLHYAFKGTPNRNVMDDGMLCLFDMGADYFGYSADISVTFPVSGKFTADQKFIYEAVLAANLAVFEAAKPGISWTCIHLLANTILLEQLKKGGLLTGCINAMLDADLGYVFQPHGVGHLLGLDVHDVGGYLEGCPQRSNKLTLKSLRTARVLEENMCFTIEPACYFIDPLLDEALSDPNKCKFFVPEILQRFRGFGGVRIEDDVLMTKNGFVNLTKVPRTVQEIENWMAGKDEILKKLNINLKS